MNEKCKYCDYVSKCSRNCEYDSIICRIQRSFPKIVDKSYEELQQENKRLEEQIKQYEDPDDLALMFMYCDSKAKDKIKELQHQLKQKDEVINKLEQWLDLEWKRPAIKICISDVVYKINELKKETTNE